MGSRQPAQQDFWIQAQPFTGPRSAPARGGALVGKMGSCALSLKELGGLMLTPTVP